MSHQSALWRWDGPGVRVDGIIVPVVLLLECLNLNKGCEFSR